MIEGKLKCGFDYAIEEEALDNMELLDAIADADTNPINISKVVRMLLGDEQRKKLYDCLRTEKGNVPITEVSNAVAEIFASKRETKN